MRTTTVRLLVPSMPLPSAAPLGRRFRAANRSCFRGFPAGAGARR